MSSIKKVNNKPALRVSKSSVNKLVVKKILTGIGYTITGLAVIYIVFALTLMRFIPTTNFSLIPVKNTTYAGNIVPVGSEIVVDITGKEHGKGLLDRAEQTFLPGKGTSVVVVEAGPNGKLKWDKPGIISVNDEILDIFLAPNDEGKAPFDEKDPYLRSEYIVTCITGACIPGDSMIIPSHSILGDPLIQYSNKK